MIIGYARVSTGSQSYQDQLGKLEAAGAVRIFREKESGARSDRPQLAKAIGSGHWQPRWPSLSTVLEGTLHAASPFFSSNAVLLSKLRQERPEGLHASLTRGKLRSVG
jgi:Resolvase, N terminal domain